MGIISIYIGFLQHATSSATVTMTGEFDKEVVLHLASSKELTF